MMRPLCSYLLYVNNSSRLRIPGFLVFVIVFTLFSSTSYSQITGSTSVCAGSTTTLSATPAGGTWSSGSTAVATVGSSSGIVTGVATGITTISYVSGAGTLTTSFTVNPLPGVFSVTGGGNMCAGGSGLHVGLTLSTSGISYQLYNGATAVGSPLTGTGAALDFGLQTSGGTYTVVATNPATSCSRTMSGSATITVNPTPTLSGPTAYCPGGSGTLTAVPSGGTWVSSTPSVATVGSSSGAVAAVGLGTSIITYTTTAGCPGTLTVTVAASTGTISASSPLCSGASETLTSSVPGGVWSTSTSSVASLGSLSGVLTGVSAGTSRITYSLGTLGCTTVATVSVIAGPSGIVGAAYACVGSTTTLSDPTPGGTWSSSNTAAATISSGGVVTGTGVGTTDISYTVGSCSSVLTITVNSMPAPVTGTSYFCMGNSVTLSDAVTGGIWSTVSTDVTVGSTSGVVTGVSAGTATIQYSIGACFVIYTVTVVPVPSAPSLPSSICVGGTATATDLTPGGLWTSSNPGVATIGTSSGLITGISSGTVLISYTQGCTVYGATAVNPIAPIGGTPQVCVGQTTVLSDAVLGGTWTSSNPLVATINSAGVVTGMAAGTTTISYTTSAGCSASTIVTVNTVPGPIVGLPSVCAGYTITLSDGSGGGTWTSSNPSVATITSGGIVSGLSFGVTTITYAFTGTTGCYVTRAVTVNSTAPAISGPSSVCLGSTITLSDIATGTWSSSAPGVATIGSSTGVVSGLSLGVTTITFTIGTGCYSTAPVGVINAPSAIYGVDSLCLGMSGLVGDITPGGVWTSGTPGIVSIGSSSGLVTGIAGGTATITYTTGPGCRATHTITVNSLPAGILGVMTVCPGSTSTLTDAMGGGTWLSSNTAIATIGSSSGTVTGVTGGVVTITYTATTGCTTTRTFTVMAAPGPIVGYSHLCMGTSASFGDAVSGGTWTSSAPGIISVGASTGLVSGVSIGSAILTYSIGTPCTVSFPVTVTPFPTAILGPSNACVGTDITLTEPVGGGIWSSSNTGIAVVGSTTGNVTGVSPATVTIFYTLGPSCTVPKSLTVSPAPLPVTGPDSVCQTQAISLFDATIGGTWSSHNPSIGTVDAFGNVTGILPGIDTVQYFNSLGCPANHPVVVNVMPSPIAGTPIACLGQTTTLTDTASGGVWTSFSPSIATIGSSTGVVSGLSLGTSTIVYSLPHGGCFVSVVLSVDPLPVPFNVTGGGPHCAGDTGTHIGIDSSLVGDNYFLYLGSSALGSIPGTGAPLDLGLVTLAGTYTVKAVHAASGCSSFMTGSAIVTVTPSVVPSVLISVSPTDTVCAGAAVTLNPTPVYGGTAPTYQWYVNAIPVAASTSYTYIPANGDRVSVAMTSNYVCPIPNPVRDTVRLSVLPFEHPSVGITAAPGDTVCKGTHVVLTAVPTYGGAAPYYEWLRNGAPTFGGATYSFTPNNGDVIYCILTSNYPCLLSGIDTSAALTMNVVDPVIPSVFIAASPGLDILLNLPDTLTAYVSGAVSPTYQWYIGDSLIAGATTNMYITTHDSMVNDSFSCVVHSYGACPVTTFGWAYVHVVDGLNPLSAGGDLSLLPNPSKGEFIVRGTLNTIADEDVDIDITDMLGRVVYKTTTRSKGGLLNERIQASDKLASGNYMLTVQTSSEYKVFHIVVEQ